MTSGSEMVFASLASVPSRERLLKRVVDSLLPQVDVVRVYLNGYRHIPEFLRRSKVQFSMSQYRGDRGAAGKFFWCEQAEGYQLICDDDLVYPEGHAAMMIDGIEKYGRKAVVSLHGSRLVEPIGTYYKSRIVFHWKSELDHDEPAHVLGTGVMAYHASTMQFEHRHFYHRNMTDALAAVACERAAVSRVILAHGAMCLEYLEPPWTIYDTNIGKDVEQTKAVRSISWSEPVLPPEVERTCQS